MSRLAHVPVRLFAIPVGLNSFAIVLRETEQTLGLAGHVAAGIALLAGLGLILVAVLYLGKVIGHWPQVREEFADPVEFPFFPLVTIALLLLALVARPYDSGIAVVLWSVASTLHFMLTVVMARRWILDTFVIDTFSPVWFLSVGGNLVAAMVGARLGFVEVPWFFLASGLVMWIVMFTITIYRFIFHGPFPALQTPSLFLLVTPPSAAFMAYLQLGDGQLDILARMLLATALFLAGLLASLIPVLARVRFSLGWWAFTFPSSALAMAMLRYHGIVANEVTLILTCGILGITALLFVVTCWRTAGWLLGITLVDHRVCLEASSDSSRGHKPCDLKQSVSRSR